MTSELIPQDGKGLRDFSRKKPKEAFEFLISNLSIWSEVAKLDPFDSADIIEELETSEAVLLLENLETTTNVKLFESLRPRAIIEIAQEMNESLVQKIFEEMDSEDIVDVFERSDSDEAQDLLDILDKTTKIDINKRLAFPKDSVGRLMSEEVAKIESGLSVSKVLEQLKLLHLDISDLVYVYVVNTENELIGVVSFREIVFADSNKLIEQVMIENPTSVNVFDDQEEAARMIKQYELLALPVVDKKMGLIGQITVNDALDVIQTELAEDFSQSFGAGAEENIFTPIFKSIRLRFPWIFINLGLAFIVSIVISQFEEVITTDALLAALMPVVALVGGNSGAQSLAIIIRGLARNDISEARVFEVIGKQTLIGSINGVLVALLSFVILYVFGLSNYALSLSIAVFGNVLIGNLFGSAIPLILRKIGYDPALASNIFLTLITDIIGFAGFLTIALILI